MNKEVDLSVSCLGKVKELKYDVIILQMCIRDRFTHVHYVNGVMIAHSHPYKGTHSHTASNIIVIAHFAAFHSLEVDVHYDFTPERPILFTVEIPESIPVTAGTHLQVISLRAPPAELA